jgi:peptide/nickel transport system substrate-binding protein
MKNKVLLLCVVLVIMVSLVLGGCSQSASTSAPATTPASTAKTATVPASSSAVSVTPTSAVKPKTGGILKVITNRGPQVIGYPPKMIDVDLFSVVPAVETLVKWGPDFTILPCLATSWKVGPDSKSMTFTLRQGVKFQDGTDFNADAVKYNLDLQIQGKRPELELVTSVDVVDNYTVRLNMSQYSSALLYDLAHYAGLIVSPASIQKNGADWAMNNVVGTGPFKLSNFKRDVSITYEKYADYWDKGKPYLDGVQIDFVADQMVASASLMAGQADMYRGTSAANAKMSFDLAAKGFRVDTAPGSATVLYGDSKNANSIFANIKVRQALEYAVDKAAICKALGYGYWQTVNQGVPKGVAAYNPDVQTHEYNPTKAKQLLADAGYPNGFSTKIIAPTAGVSADAVVSIQGYLKAVGINAEINTVDAGQWTKTRAQGWKDAIVVYGSSYPTGNWAVYLNREFPTNYTLWPTVQRPAGYTELINQIFAATDLATQTRLNQQLAKLLADDETFAPLWIGVILAIKQSYVHDDTMCVVHQMAWYPGDTWLSK